MSEDRFERHRQPWTTAISKALKRSEESTKDRAKVDGLTIAKLR
jgi:hypothetical protein